MRKVVIGSMIGIALLSGCASRGSGPSSGHGGVVRLVPQGGLPGNAYGLAYQTCRSADISTLARDVHTTSTRPQLVAGAFAQASFTAKAQPFAARGCEDALTGRPATPPAGSPRT